MRAIRQLLFATSLVPALLLTAVGCQKQDADPNKKVLYKGPLLESDNVEELMSDSAKLQIKLTGPLEQQFENGDMRYPKSVKVTFYEKDGKTIKNTLRGNYGKYDKAKNLYILRGDVRVKNEEKQQSLKTEELYYDRLKGTIYTDKFVNIQTPTERLEGYGMTAAQDFSRYTILKPTGVFTVDQSPTP